MRHDFLYAVRNLRRKPLFTAVTVLTLALGIGANTAIVSVVHGVLLKPLPYPHPERLMMLWTYNPRQGFDKDVGTYPNFEDWRRESRTFERMAAYSGANVTLTGAGNPAHIRGATVTPGFFETIGVPPSAGRVFDARDDRANNDRIAILSDGLWQRRFGGDPTVVGRTVMLNGVAHEVVGVMPRGFAHPEDAEIWTPLVASERFAALMRARGSFWLTVIGRLQPGTDRATAQAEMDAIASRLEQQYPANAGLGVRLVSIHDETVGEVRRPLLMLMGAVCLVLLIACANVANLLLTQVASRQKELAIRAALGAGRGRLARQMLTESALLALVGGGAGLLVAAWGVDVLPALAPANVPRLATIQLDSWVVAYAAIASLATGLAFGAAPAFHALTARTGDHLKEGGRSGAEGAGGRRLRSTLASAEIALALILLIGAALLGRSILAMARVDLGFDPARVLTLRLELPEKRYPHPGQVSAFFTQLAGRLAGLPGVTSVSAGTSVLLPTLPASGSLTVEGYVPPQNAVNVPVPYDAVLPGFFETLRIPLITGRTFTPSDGPDAQRVVVVNESFVRRYFPDGRALGRRVTYDRASANAVWYTIVGIVGDTRRAGLDREPWAELYYAHAQAPDRFMIVVVRTAGDPATLARAAQAEVWAVDPEQPVASVRTLDALLARSQANRRFTTLLLGVFAIVALVLAAIGVYGVIAYSTAQRTQEIGIRLALGAQRRDVLAIVLGDGVRIAAGGLVVGVLAALPLTRLLSNLLYGVGPADRLTFVTLPLVLLAVAVAASWIPARRALRVDPVVALRAE